MNKSVSPSRQYVAVVSNHRFEGYHFRKFELPMSLPNNSEVASWYFLNEIDPIEACIDGCYSFEDYSNIKNVVSTENKNESDYEI